MVKDVSEIRFSLLAMTTSRYYAYSKLIILRKYPTVRTRNRSPVEQHPTAPNLPYCLWNRYLNFKPEINLAEFYSDMPRSHARRTIGAHNHLRRNASSVCERCSSVHSILAHSSHRSSLKQNCPISHRVTT